MRTSITKLPLAFAVMALIALASVANAEEKPKTLNAKEKAAARKEAAKASKEKKLAQKRLSRIWKTAAPVEGFESAEMFSAIESGDIEVVIKTVSEKKSNVIVTNKTEKPLAIEMPATFSAVPVMRQGLGGFGGGAGGGQGGGGRGGGGQGGGGQGAGGGFGGGGQGGGFGGGGRGGGAGGGVFNIPPGKVGKVAITTVCLEHGKPNPRSTMDYVIRPLTEVTSDPKVAEICQMLAADEIVQPVAQAASWNVTDKLSWNELLTKNRLERMDGYFERFFSPQQLYFAQQVVAVAGQRAEENAKSSGDDKFVSPGELYSQQK